MSPSLPREGRGFFVPGLGAAFIEQRRKAHAGVGDGAAAAGQVWSPLFYGGEKKEEPLLSKRGRGKMFLPEAKKWNDPLPAGRESC